MSCKNETKKSSVATAAVGGSPYAKKDNATMQSLVYGRPIGSFLHGTIFEINSENIAALENNFDFGDSVQKNQRDLTQAIKTAEFFSKITGGMMGGEEALIKGCTRKDRDSLLDELNSAKPRLKKQIATFKDELEKVGAKTCPECGNFVESGRWVSEHHTADCIKGQSDRLSCEIESLMERKFEMSAEGMHSPAIDKQIKQAQKKLDALQNKK